MVIELKSTIPPFLKKKVYAIHHNLYFGVGVSSVCAVCVFITV